MAYQISFFLYIDIKEMNLPEGSTVKVRYCVTRAFLVPICWVHIGVYIYKYIWIFPLFVYLRFSFKILGITWKYFHSIKHIEEGSCSFIKGAEEEKAHSSPSLRGMLEPGVMRNLRSKPWGEAVSGFIETCLAYGVMTPCKLNSSEQCQG